MRDGDRYVIADGPVRILLIDDAPLLRRAIAAELDRSANLHTAVTSSDIQQVRQGLMKMHPDVIIMDLELQATDPFDLLRKLRGHYPVPLIAIAAATNAGAKNALRATSLGALEVVRRPPDARGSAMTAFCQDLARVIQIAVSGARPLPRTLRPAVRMTSFRAAGVHPRRHVIAIGASTGGTEAVTALLKRVPVDCPPIVIVQHMPPGFTQSFAERLNGLSPMRVSEAVDGEALREGCAIVARGDTHLTIRQAGNGWVARYTDQTLVHHHCPSVDVLFESAAKAVGPYAAGVLLTGMGADGAEGLLSMRRAGAITVAQTEASCVVYGMPKEAVTLGAVAFSAAPEDIPDVLLRAMQKVAETSRPARVHAD